MDRKMFSNVKQKFAQRLIGCVMAYCYARSSHSDNQCQNQSGAHLLEICLFFVDSIFVYYRKPYILFTTKI